MSNQPQSSIRANSRCGLGAATGAERAPATSAKAARSIALGELRACKDKNLRVGLAC